MRIKLKQYLAKVQAKTKHSIYSNYLNCYKSPHLLLNHLCIHSFMHKSLQQTFWLCAFALCIHISNRILIDGRRRCVLSGLCSLSLQKRYLEDAAQLLQFAFTETSTTERGLGIDPGNQAISSSVLFIFSLKTARAWFLFTQESMGCRKFLFHLQLPSHPSAICVLAAWLSESLRIELS